MRTYKQVSLGILAVVSTMLAGCHRTATLKTISSSGSSYAEAPAKGGEHQLIQGPLPAHFQATIYEVEAPVGRMDSVDAKALEKQAGTAEGLLNALSKVGAARILYRFDQPVNVVSQKLFMGKSEPLVTSTRLSPSGQTINSVTYQQIGAAVSLSAPAVRDKHPAVTVAVELSVMGRTGVEVVPDAKLPAIRTVSTAHQSALEFGQPRVILAGDSASLDQKASPVLYVIRYLFNR
jgi:hypothetical protein